MMAVNLLIKVPRKVKKKIKKNLQRKNKKKRRTRKNHQTKILRKKQKKIINRNLLTKVPQMTQRIKLSPQLKEKKVMIK